MFVHICFGTRAEGFDVTLYTREARRNPRDFDLVLCLMGEETLLTRGRIFLAWNRLTGGVHGAMQRHWHLVPTALISFGYPHYLYDAPRLPCVINAYATMDTMQRAWIAFSAVRRSLAKARLTPSAACLTGDFSGASARQARH